jgi:hypothetical protein
MAYSPPQKKKKIRPWWRGKNLNEERLLVREEVVKTRKGVTV